MKAGANATARVVALANDSFDPNEILQIAQRQGITRGALQAKITATEAGAPLDREKALAAMRALRTILEEAEATA